MPLPSTCCRIYGTHPRWIPWLVPGTLLALRTRGLEKLESARRPSSPGFGPIPRAAALFSNTSKFSNMLSLFSIRSNEVSSTSSVVVVYKVQRMCHGPLRVRGHSGSGFTQGHDQGQWSWSSSGIIPHLELAVPQSILLQAFGVNHQ